MNSLKDTLNSLWASKILGYQVDMLSCSVSFLLETIDNGESNRFKLIFNKISMFYFVNNVTDSRMNIIDSDKGDYLELTSVNILEDSSLLINSCKDK